MYRNVLRYLLQGKCQEGIVELVLSVSENCSDYPCDLFAKTLQRAILKTNTHLDISPTLIAVSPGTAFKEPGTFLPTLSIELSSKPRYILLYLPHGKCQEGEVAIMFRLSRNCFKSTRYLCAVNLPTAKRKSSKHLAVCPTSKVPRESLLSLSLSTVCTVPVTSLLTFS